MKRFLTKKFLIWGGIGAIILIGGFLVFKNGNGKQVVTVVRADIVQEVAATGKVKPNQSVDLGFDQSGRIAGVNTFVGEKVMKGEILANLETGGVLADLEKAKASLREEEIKLSEIRDTSPLTYGDAAKNLDSEIKESFSLADNAVRNKTDQFFKSIPDNPRFEISITSGNFVHYFNVPTDLTIDINNRRKNIELVLNNWQNRLLNLSSKNLVAEADKAISDLNSISSFLDKMALAVNTFTSADYTYDTTVSTYKTTISGARSDIAGAVSGLVTAKDKYNAAGSLGEGGEFDDVLVQETKVAQARANVNSYAAALEKALIRAPFDGVVTLQDAKAGGIVSPNEALISMVGENEMYIEANISEINIGKIAVGNAVDISFDAFPGEVFGGFVSFVEPGDVILDGVVNYKIRVELGEVLAGEDGQLIMRFANPDPKIKSGLTTNLKIKTAKKERVLAVPAYAIKKEGDKSSINRLVGEKLEKIEVKLGIVGNNGLVEVLNGLNEGDLVTF